MPMPNQPLKQQLELVTPCRAKDVQVEFTMLDPHVRATLQPDNKVSLHLFVL